MKIEVGQIYHIYNQGNNGNIIFFEEKDYRLFMQKINQYFLPYCKIVGWCLLPHQFNLMIYTEAKSNLLHKSGIRYINSISWAVKTLLSTYAQVINKKLKRNSSLFQQNTNVRQLTDYNSGFSAADSCLNYIHFNPVLQKFVAIPGEWKYSSYLYYTEQGSEWENEIKVDISILKNIHKDLNFNVLSLDDSILRECIL